MSATPLNGKYKYLVHISKSEKKINCVTDTWLFFVCVCVVNEEIFNLDQKALVMHVYNFMGELIG